MTISSLFQPLQLINSLVLHSHRIKHIIVMSTIARRSILRAVGTGQSIVATWGRGNADI